MTNEDAAALAALNQTLRRLVVEIQQLNLRLDMLGFPRPKEDDRDRGTAESD